MCRDRNSTLNPSSATLPSVLFLVGYRQIQVLDIDIRYICRCRCRYNIKEPWRLADTLYSKYQHRRELSIKVIVLHRERLMEGFLNLMCAVWKSVVMKSLLWGEDPQVNYGQNHICRRPESSLGSGQHPAGSVHTQAHVYTKACPLFIPTSSSSSSS